METVYSYINIACGNIISWSLFLVWLIHLPMHSISQMKRLTHWNKKETSDCHSHLHLIHLYLMTNRVYCLLDKQVFARASISAFTLGFGHFFSNCSYCTMMWGFKIWTVTCNFQQCDILTSVDSDEPVQPPFKLKNSKRCSVRSSTVI